MRHALLTGDNINGSMGYITAEEEQYIIQEDVVVEEYFTSKIGIIMGGFQCIVRDTENTLSERTLVG